MDTIEFSKLTGWRCEHCGDSGRRGFIRDKQGERVCLACGWSPSNTRQRETIMELQRSLDARDVRIDELTAKCAQLESQLQAWREWQAETQVIKDWQRRTERDRAADRRMNESDRLAKLEAYVERLHYHINQGRPLKPKP